MTTTLTLGSGALAEAVEMLCKGGLVAFPTETVYGLGADATDDAAVVRIFEAKGRPRFNPLICHFPDAVAASRQVDFDGRAEKLAAAFWPGPLTLVLPRAPSCGVSLLCSAGLDSLAVRVPDQPLALELLRRVGRSLAAPSANRSGRVSPTTASHVSEELGGRVDLILDGGTCRVGLESTVLALTDGRPRLLRHGGVTLEALEEALGEEILTALPSPSGQGLASPGLLESHYAPTRPLRLQARDLRPGEALLAFGPDEPQGALATINLSPAGDLAEAAAALFGALRKLDQPHVGAIAVMPVPDHGLGRAINDRLRRAAAPRPPGTEAP